MKFARMSKGARDVEPYKCKYEWPEDCFCQGGEDGMVFTRGTLEESIKDPVKGLEAIAGVTPHYKTCFFEAFPRNPDTFLRGEGNSMVEAEEKAWAEYQNYNKCKKHFWIAKGYTNGCGFCKFCKLFQSNIFPVKPSSRAELQEFLEHYERLLPGFADHADSYRGMCEKIAEFKQRLLVAPEVVEWVEPAGYWDGEKPTTSQEVPA